MKFEYKATLYASALVIAISVLTGKIFALTPKTELHPQATVERLRIIIE